MAQTVGMWLVEKFPTAKRVTLRRMLAAGRVEVNGAACRKWNQALPTTAQVRVLERAARPSKPTDAGLEIVFEDADLLVVNKPAGLLTSTVERERRKTLLAMVREARPRNRIGLIHRLDRDASGLLIFSKTERAYHSLKGQFFRHSVEREYRAVVHGMPDPAKGRIESRLTERTDGRVRSTRATDRGVWAVTDYDVLESANGRSVVKVILQTGRKHQIRVHLSEKGTPIVGDQVYGSGKVGEQLMLSAVRLAIDHPATGQRMTFEVER